MEKALVDKIKEMLDIFEQEKLKTGRIHPCYRILKKMTEKINIRWLGETQDVSDRVVTIHSVPGLLGIVDDIGETATIYENDLQQKRWEYLEWIGDEYTKALNDYQNEIDDIVNKRVQTPTKTQRRLYDYGQTLLALNFPEAINMAHRGYNQTMKIYARAKKKVMEDG